MKVSLVDKNYRFNPHDLGQTVVAKVEIICDTDDQLINVLSYISSMDLSQFPKEDKYSLLSKSDSGVHEPKPEPDNALENPESEPVENEVEESPMGPISSLEIE